MLEFLTLLLGLVTGPRTIELDAGPEVARIELRLDGTVLASATERPWRFEVDFGADLLPHRLEARGLDRHGREVARRQLLVNLPRPETAATITLRRDAKGKSFGQVHWESRVGAPLEGWDVELDGKSIEVQDLASFPLPRHDRERLHYLRVTLHFEGYEPVVSEAIFGGRYGDEIATELTGVPIEGLGSRVGAAELAGRVRAEGQEVVPVAVERGEPTLVVVASEAAWRYLDGDARRQAERSASLARTRAIGPLPSRARAHMVWARPRRTSTAGDVFDLFPVLRPIGPPGVGLHYLIFRHLQPQPSSAPELLTDAAASAVLFAHSTQRPRAVIVLTDGESTDASRLTPAQVRRYAEALQVPLVVWTTGVGESGPWGETVRVRDAPSFAVALRPVVAQLERQALVLLEGSWLPHHVSIDVVP